MHDFHLQITDGQTTTAVIHQPLQCQWPTVAMTNSLIDTNDDDKGNKDGGNKDGADSL